jgi:molecular chaperone GrpE
MESDNNKQNPSNSDAEESKSHSEIVAEGEAQEIDHQKAAFEAAQKAEREILYIRAEFDNYKKRLLKDQDTAIKMANKNMVSEIVSVLDLFEHAIAHSSKLKSKGDNDVTNFVTGIEMTRSELIQLLSKFGVELIGQVGETFDPLKHEAISEVEAQGQTTNTVHSVVQKGCMLHGKLLKPARVVVVKARE